MTYPVPRIVRRVCALYDDDDDDNDDERERGRDLNELQAILKRTNNKVKSDSAKSVDAQ